MPREPKPTFLWRLRRLVAAPETARATDAQLLERFVRLRDDMAFELLVWRHGPMVLGLCRRLLRHAQDAEDAFQATFLTLVRKAGSIGKRDSVGSWLYKVAYRIALQARQTAAARVAREQRVARTAAVACVVEPADFDLHAAVAEEVGQLPEKYRAAVVLCYLQGKTHEEASRQLGCPKGTIAVRLMRAKERLRCRLESRGLTLSAGTLAAVLSERAAFAVSDLLLHKTLRAALLLAAGGGLAAGGVSLPAMALMEGAVQAMWWTQVKMAVGAMLAVAALGAGGGWIALQGAGTQEAVARDEVAAQKPAPDSLPKKDAKADTGPGHPEQVMNRSEVELLKQRDTMRAELETYESEIAKLRHKSRKELVAAEEELRFLEREHALERDKEAAERKDLQENLRSNQIELRKREELLQKQLEAHGNDHPHVKESETAMRAIFQRLQGANKDRNIFEERSREREHERSLVIVRARQALADIEQRQQREERPWVTKQSYVQDAMQNINAKLGEVQFPWIWGPQREQRPVAPEAKLDRLLQEIEALRREVRELKSTKREP